MKKHGTSMSWSISPPTEKIKKEILELSIRNGFHTASTYLMLYGKMYPPHKNKFNLSEKRSQEIVDHFKKRVEDYLHGYLTVEGKIEGYFTIARMAKMRSSEGYTHIELSILFISEHHRKKGYGQSAMKDQIFKLLELAWLFDPTIILYVVSEPESIAFYEKVGFTRKNPDNIKFDQDFDKKEKNKYLFYTYKNSIF